MSDVATGLPVTLDDETRKYVWGEGLAYAVSGTTLEVYHTDRLGSVRAITDGLGAVSATYRTDEFGIPTASAGGSTQPFAYTGEPRDATGLSYLRARYYDPSLGRFLSRDSFGGISCQPQGLNRYAYAANNPLARVDPSGLDSRVKGGPVPMPGPPPLDPICLGLYNKISEHVQGIIAKYYDFVSDKYNLSRGGAAPGGSTYPGHVTRYKGLLDGYDNMRQDWRNNNCPGDPPSLDPQYRSIPAPGPNVKGPSFDPIVRVAGGGASLYLLYRLLRLLPSLLPPLWPTAPANAILP